MTVTEMILDPLPKEGRTSAAVLSVLAKWYAAHSAVRRLCAIEESRRMRVIVTIEPTHDSDDLYPTWLANGHQWARELQSRIEGPVQLEVMLEPLLAGFLATIEGVLVADLFWRNSSMPADDPRDDAGESAPGGPADEGVVDTFV